MAKVINNLCVLELDLNDLIDYLFTDLEASGEDFRNHLIDTYNINLPEINPYKTNMVIVEGKVHLTIED